MSTSSGEVKLRVVEERGAKVLLVSFPDPQQDPQYCTEDLGVRLTLSFSLLLMQGCTIYKHEDAVFVGKLLKGCDAEQSGMYRIY